MADTTFSAGTVVTHQWLNDANQATYKDHINVKSDPYNATGDGTTDDTAAIQAAFTDAQSLGRPVYFPPGTYKYTTEIQVGSNVSGVYGAGFNTILNPVSCGGIQVLWRGFLPAGTFLRDFVLSGTTCENFNGIYCNNTAASGHKVTGMLVENVHVKNFKVGLYCRNAWNWDVVACYFYNNYNGVWLNGQNISVSFDNTFIQAGSITGSGAKYGMLIDSIAGESTQATVLTGVGIYNYEYDLYISLAFDFAAYGCNFDIATIAAVTIVTVSGGCTIRDSWVETYNAAAITTGINIADRGAAARDKIVIDGCFIRATLTFAGSIGIYVGSNQLGVTTNNNTIGTNTLPWTTGIKNNVANNHVAKFNTIYASTTAIAVDSNGDGYEIGPNVIQSGTPITFTSGAVQPTNFSYYAQGSFTITLSGMTAGTTGTVNWISTGQVVVLSLTSNITGTSNTNAMTGSTLPQEIRPNVSQFLHPIVSDNTVYQLGRAVVANTGVMTFYKDPTAAVFTAAGTKGLSAGTMTYVRN